MDEQVDSFQSETNSAGPSKPPARSTRRGLNQTKRKKQLDELLDPGRIEPRGIESSEDRAGIESGLGRIEPSEPVESSDYKNKLKVYVLSGQIKDLYGKIITEHELNKMSEQECENVYKICELKMAQRISGSVVDGIITVVGNLCSKTLPIENKDKYITELKMITL